MAEKEYIRLTGARRKSGFAVVSIARSSLWLGKDHLLCIETNGYTETYKRFYFRDIQAIYTQRSIRRVVWNWILGVPAALILFGWGYDLIAKSRMTPGVIIFASVVTTIFGIPLLLNNVFGSTCVCRLRTAVQEDQLPSLNRDKRVSKVMARIRPLIAEAQGVLAREEIPARMQELAAQNQPRLVVDDPNLPPRMLS